MTRWAIRWLPRRVRVRAGECRHSGAPWRESDQKERCLPTCGLRLPTGGPTGTVTVDEQRVGALSVAHADFDLAGLSGPGGVQPSGAWMQEIPGRNRKQKRR